MLILAVRPQIHRHVKDVDVKQHYVNDYGMFISGASAI